MSNTSSSCSCYWRNKMEREVVINATNVVAVCRELHHHHPRQFRRRLRSRHMCPERVQKQDQDQTWTHTLRTRVETTFIWTWRVDICDICAELAFESATAWFFYIHLRHYFPALVPCPKEVTNSYARSFTMCSALLDANATDHGTMQVLRKAYRLHTARAKTFSLTSSMASWALATRTVRHRANSRARYRFFIVPRCCCCVCSVKCFLSVDWAFLIWCSSSVGF